MFEEKSYKIVEVRWNFVCVRIENDFIVIYDVHDSIARNFMS